MTGTFVNAAAILAGGTAGLLIHSRLPARFSHIVFQGIGLFTIFLGFSMAMKTGNYLVMIFSIVLGSISGELIDIDKRINSFSETMKKFTGSANARFSEGLVTSFLLFCMGSMTILGAFEEGLGNNPTLLYAKSVLDGVSSIALAAAMGAGVLFSIVPLIIYQGGLTLFASKLGNLMSEPVMNELTAVGGLLLIGLGIGILDIKKIKILNMLPALLFAVFLGWLLL
jgi:uncharacterized protein